MSKTLILFLLLVVFAAGVVVLLVSRAKATDEFFKGTQVLGGAVYEQI